MSLSRIPLFLFLSLVMAGVVVPAQVQAQKVYEVPMTLLTGSAPAHKVAYLLDPKNNPVPKEPFALWAGLPSLKDLSPQAARLFVPASPDAFHLPAEVRGVIPEEGGENNRITVLGTSRTPDVNIGHGTPIGTVLEEIGWLGQANKPIEVGATLWRFKDEIQEPFAQMLKDWDGKTPLIRQIDSDDIWKVPSTGNYHKGSPRYKLTASVPLDMEFHSMLASEHKNPALVEDHVRLTVARKLDAGGSELQVDSQLSAFIDSEGGFWEPVLVPQFSPGNDLVVLLPENHDKDGVKATFLQLHLGVPGRG